MFTLNVSFAFSFGLYFQISSYGFITLEEDFTTDYEDYYNFQYSFPFNKALVSPLWDDWYPDWDYWNPDPSGKLYHRQTTVDLEVQQ